MTEIILIGMIAIVLLVEINMFLYVQKKTEMISRKIRKTTAR